MDKRYVLLILAVLLTAAGFAPLHALEVRASGGAGHVVWLQRVSPGDTFTLSFVHSVEKSDVTDYFRIDGDYRIILYQTEFGSLNTGLPAVVSGGEVFERTERGFRLSNLGRVLPEILLRVSETYGGTLAIGGAVVHLPSLAESGLVRISTRVVSAWGLLWWKIRT